MNIPYLDIITKKVRKNFTGNGTLNPQRDWIFLISAGCIALIVSVSLSYFSSRTATGDSAVEAASPTNEVKTTSLEIVQSIFQMRLSERVKYESTLHFVDPSQ